MCDEFSFFFFLSFFSQVASKKSVLLSLLQSQPHLIFVGGVEGNFRDLLVPGPEVGDVMSGEFDAFEQRRFRRVAGALSLQHRDLLLTSFELSAVAQGRASEGGNAMERLDGGKCLKFNNVDPV